MATRWILMACTVLLALIFSLLIYHNCIKNNQTNSIKNEPDDIQGKGSLGESDDRSNDARRPVMKSVISQGENSTVWRGFFNGKCVALKYFSRSEGSLWQNECYIYSMLTPGHENILKFIAASDSNDNLNQFWLATSFYDQGSLQDYLTAHTLTWDRLLTMAKCITAGLSFLHSEWQLDGKPKPAIAHQDLKSKNILVGNDGTCVLADFGLSMDLSQGYLSQVHRNGQVGTYRYMAPEKLEARIDVENPESFKQIDVYSLALVLWELLSRCHITDEPENTDNICTNFTLPFEDVVGCSPTLEQMTKSVVVNGCRPSLPSGLSSHQSKNEVTCVWTTIKECWDNDPEARLTAACINTRLISLVS
ncbi:TGF-beta receptor type-2-like [Actinia tenebrosa]|uniref:receptor protein serine/threonine kinase n=1 Tax=Actinia tenebrosa TaxID=6105 RepID=A0A6P8HV03_ACTTE|nr:TGF-beta receptor type-2-like [Actinia tenebrosa]